MEANPIGGLGLLGAAGATGASSPAPAAAPAAYPAITLAQQLAAAAQLPAVQKITDAQAQADAAARAQQATIAGYMHSLAPIVAGIAPAVQQGYQQAAGMDALLGKGFGDELAGQQQANQQQAGQILQNAGATPGQVSAVNTAIGGPGTANALGYLNGGLPAQGLNQAGAAFGAATRALPAEFAGMGLQQVQSLQARQQAADAGFAQKQTDLAAQFPGLVEKTLVGLGGKTHTFGDSRTGFYSIDPLTGAVTQLTKAAPQAPKTFGDAQTGFYTLDPTSGKVTQITKGIVQPKTFGNTQTGYYSINPATGQVTQLTQGVVQPKVFGSPTTGYYSIDPTSGRVTQMTKGVAKPAAVNVTLSRSTGYVSYLGSDGNVYAVTGKDGKPIPYQGGTSTAISTDRIVAAHLQGMKKGNATYIHDQADPNAGKNGAPAGYVLKPGTGSASYQDMLSYAVNAYGGNLARATQAVNRLLAPGEGGRPYDTIKQALPNIEENVAASIKNGQPASTAYKTAIATGAFPAKLQKALVYTINRLYTQDYFKNNPKASSLPAGVLVSS